MPTDPRKRQKKLENRAAKRKLKQHQLSRETNAGSAVRLTAAAKYPVLHSLATTDLWDQGLGWVCLSRETPNGMVAFAVFLVDRYCLGVKNVTFDVVPRSTYENQVLRKMRSELSSKSLAPADVRKLVESAVDYAQGLGFPPHPDYHKAKGIFGTIDSSAATETIDFGKDGKPYFIAGPNDSPQRCRHIMNTLRDKFGEDGWHYLIPVSPSQTGILEEDDDVPES